MKKPWHFLVLSLTFYATAFILTSKEFGLSDSFFVLMYNLLIAGGALLGVKLRGYLKVDIGTIGVLVGVIVYFNIRNFGIYFKGALLSCLWALGSGILIYVPVYAYKLTKEQLESEY